MKISSAEFVKSVVEISQLPKLRLPEIAFAGRSNVGKSRLLNALTNKKKLAAISATPGKTQAINYFKINDRYYFVDLPGYGFAKVSKKMRAQWQTLIESYLIGSEQLCSVVVIIDARHKVSSLDIQMLEWLREKSIPPIVVATKADKLSSNQLVSQLRRNVDSLSELDVQVVLPFSAVNGYGKKQVLQAVFEKLIL
jgi:GTP-binding protein